MPESFVPHDLVTIIIPTFNEAGSIKHVLDALEVFGLPIVVVDDNSPDMTALMVDGWQHDHPKAEVMCLRRTERGLSSAARAGARHSATPYVLVMDGDGQHDPRDVALLLADLRVNRPDIVIGSRFYRGITPYGLSGWRRMISRTLNGFANVVAKTRSSDPMTGFAIIQRDLLLRTRTTGYKWLLEVLVNRELRLTEVPITFHAREAGKSKASLRELLLILKTPRWS